MGEYIIKSLHGFSFIMPKIQAYQQTGPRGKQTIVIVSQVTQILGFLDTDFKRTEEHA